MGMNRNDHGQLHPFSGRSQIVAVGGRASNSAVLRSAVKRAAAFVVLLIACAGGEAFAASPKLSVVLPRGGQRGTDVDVTLHGKRLNDAQAVLFYRDGIEAVDIKRHPKNKKLMVATFRIAPDAPLGQHPLRIRTASGVSDLHTFWVGPFAQVEESEPNNEFDAPQTVAMNRTILGRVTSEDVDYFAVDAKKGQRISVELEAMRLGEGMFDAAVAILDSKRFELAVCDDSSLYLQDPVVSAIAPADGTYTVMVRESSYQGGGNDRYRLHVSDAPRPVVTYPLGGPAGQGIDVAFRGDPAGDVTQRITLPDKPDARHEVFIDGAATPSGNVMRVSPFGNVMEVEPNANRNQATKHAGDLPIAFNGVIETEGDQDWFRFTAKKGTYFINVYARQLRSPLDPVINIFDGKTGKHIAGNDDNRQPDSFLRFNCKKPGEYVIRMRDHLGSGSPLHVYRIEITRPEPSVSVTIPSLQRYKQDRQHFAVPQGNRYATLIRIDRDHIRGDATVAFPQLPEGVTVAHDVIASNLDVLPVVMEARADAPVAGGLYDIVATVKGKNREARGGFSQWIGMVRGQNNTYFYETTVPRVPIVVTKPAPFRVQIIEPKIPLVRNGRMNLGIKVHRDEGFNQNVKVRMLWNPPGVGSTYQIDVPKDKDVGYLPLSAQWNAEVRASKIAVIAVAYPYGPQWVSSQLATLRTAEPFAHVKINMTAVEQGKATKLLVTLTPKRPFDGLGKAELLGLPPNVSTKPLEFDKDTKQLTFEIETNEKAPPGTHKGLFLQLTVPQDGEDIVWHWGHGGTLRIDRPRPKKEDKPKPEPKKQEAKKQDGKPAEKPLSRLEQLRQQQENE